ncbi:MAG: hypothetical protein EA424_05690 [Planctomycetaceae bacterium]|nr:MAG: hypothetical protein EA424_05690 [Planctomycetaceae bacterium]
MMALPWRLNRRWWRGSGGGWCSRFGFPAERHDLAAEHPEIVDRMLHHLRKWQQSCRDSAAVYGIGR